MRSLATLGLVILSALPLAARDHHHGPWRGPRRVVVLDAFEGRSFDRYARDDRYDRDDDRWEGRAVRDDRPRYRAYDDDVVLVRPRPLAPPWRSRIVLRFGW
jgi:hypothetical protein